MKNEFNMVNIELNGLATQTPSTLTSLDNPRMKKLSYDSKEAASALHMNIGD